MSIEANIVYLEEELKSNRERLKLMVEYLRQNPSISIYKRTIRGNIYYYKKYWKGGKSISEFLCKDDGAFEERSKEIKAANEKRQHVKKQFEHLNKVTAAMEKQLKIARRTYDNV